MKFLRNCVLAMALAMSAHGFQVSSPTPRLVEPTRRDFFISSLAFVSVVAGNQQEAHASVGRGYHISRKLKEQEARKRENAPLRDLPSGVAIQEFRSGRTGFEVKRDSVITAEIRMAGSPPKTTKFTLGTGKILSGLEEGLLGMNLNGARRITVPADVVQQGMEQGQLPLPLNALTSTQLEQWFAQAASVLQYEVQVTALN